MPRSGEAISPGDSAPVATWYTSGSKREKLRRSISVMSTGARRSFLTAWTPPNPPPTTTTRWRFVGSTLIGQATVLEATVLPWRFENCSC
jgi:hypothetical protein